MGHVTGRGPCRLRIRAAVCLGELNAFDCVIRGLRETEERETESEEGHAVGSKSCGPGRKYGYDV